MGPAAGWITTLEEGKMRFGVFYQGLAAGLMKGEHD